MIEVTDLCVGYVQFRKSFKRLAMTKDTAPTNSEALAQTALVAVVGAGTMGAGIAQVAAAAGHAVVLYDLRTEAVPTAVESVRRNFEKLSLKGKISQKAASSAIERLGAAANLGELSGAGIVIEAIAEDLDAKRRLLREIESLVDPNCILTTNTSSLSVSAIAAALHAPERLTGMHFFNPAPLMDLVEVVAGLATNPRILATVHATARAWGKTPVYVRSTPGFIVNRVARPFYGEALLLLAEQAASPATIDAIMREAGGFRMGPFELMDLVGLDIGLAVSESLFNAFFGDARYRPSFIQEEMVRAGHLGRKARRGFYSYADDAPAPLPDTEPAAPKPRRVTLPMAGPLATALETRLAGSGIALSRAAHSSSDSNCVEIDGTIFAVTDGRSATQFAQETGRRNLVTLDLAIDYTTAPRVAIAKASTCEDHAYWSAVGLLQAAGYAVSRVKDVPGIAVMRTVAMLANEAADAVNQGVATPADVDVAMRKGVNYPRGPLAWADDVGLETVHKVLSNLAAHYGGERYRVSPRIQELVWSGRKVYDAAGDGQPASATVDSARGYR